ncbi:MAG TPA: SCO2322 family protein [Candidatus Nanopelagicaceae bacterium]|nr:SCO2322 family protein [Candidatus Nanopelagicaceae bacterium]
MFSKSARLISLSLLIIASSIFIPASNAATGYRYWGYFQAQGGATSWTAAMTGPSVEVKDGDVEGWTFVFSNNDIPAIAPMMDPDFATLCDGIPETAGKVRVGLVVDFGDANIAPSGETPMEFFSDCVVVPTGSVGLDVLKSVLDVRAGDSGLICGIAGYPAQECGAEIEAPTAQEAVTTSAPIEDAQQASRSTPLLMAVLAAMLLVGFIFNRRRNR